jgi:hypothetical protein
VERHWHQSTRSLPLWHGAWRYSRAVRQGDPIQGWKIHLSATVLSANEVFARAFPILREHDALFKVPAELALLAHLNSGNAGFSQVGKFITVYTRSDQEAVMLARTLYLATRGLAAPEIPFDIRYRRNGSVFYRYGAYATGVNGAPVSILDAAGKPHRDSRLPRRAVPRWLADPFNDGRKTQWSATGPIGLDYLVFKAFAQRGKGGVFEALDLSVSPARLAIIKQGRRHGDTDWNGEDGFARVKREGQTLRALRAAGIPVPKVFRQFNHGGHRYLVLEKICGRPLLPRKRQQSTKPSWRRAPRVLDEVGGMLSRLHAAGWVWRDCKPSHIFFHRGTCRLIDFEGACRIDQTELLPWGSPDYVPPLYRGKFSRRAGTFEDDYALGVIAFQFLSGEFPPSGSRRRASIYKASRCPDSLRSRIESLLRV